MAKGDGPYKIVQRVGDNAYKVELPGDINIFATFKVGDLTPYIEDEDKDIGDLRANPLQGGEVDADQTMRPNSLSTSRLGLTLGP